MSTATERLDKCNRHLNELDAAIRSHAEAIETWLRTYPRISPQREAAWEKVQAASTRITLIREEIKEMVL